MENNIVLSQIPAEELAGMIARAVRAQIGPMPTAALPDTERLRTTKEAADFFQVSEPTLRDWTRRELVKGSRIAGRVRYRHADLLDALQRISVRKSQRHHTR
ncbi:MAG: helix-turn-helix domain-containing protein [Flavobacteriales bacterium]|nr:MAG: helix-turn-helix domain-containing protein [Flavobacteriales bacterium]